MALIRNRSFNTRRQAVELLVRDCHLLIRPEVIEWFSYTHIHFPESELKEKAEEIADKQLRKAFGRRADWEKTIEYVVAPYYRFITSSSPSYFDFNLNLNCVASIEVYWIRGTNEYSTKCVVIDTIKKNVEKFKLPLDFLQAISIGDLSHFLQKERDNQGYFTWHIPSIDQDIKLHGVLLRSLSSVFQGKPLGPALVWCGLLSKSEGMLAEQSLKVLPAPAHMSVNGKEPVCTMEEVKEALTGKSLGMTVKDAMNALDAIFDPSLTLEENIRRCLQYKDNNGRV